MTKASPAKSLPLIDTPTWMRAVESGDATLVKSLLAAGADVNAVSEGGKTALIRAATRGYVDIVRILLDAGADVNARKENGATALIVAIFFGYTDVVRALLAGGADPHALTPQGTSAEKWAQSIGFTEIVELLRNAGTIRAEDSAPESPAIAQKQIEAVTLFPSDGPFRTVVPLSEIETPPQLAENLPQPEAIAAETETEEPEVLRRESDVSMRDEHEEATLVPGRARRRNTTRAPFTRARSFVRTLQSWPVIALSLCLLLVAGLILEADWQKSRRSAKLAQPVEFATEAAPSQPAPQVAPEVTDAPETEVNASAPVVASGALDDTNPKPDKTAKDTPAQMLPSSPTNTVNTARTESKAAHGVSAPSSIRRAATEDAPAREASVPTRRAKETAAATMRRDTRPVRRPQNTDERVQTSSSPALSLPVFSPPQPAKSDKKKVIQWP